MRRLTISILAALVIAAAFASQAGAAANPVLGAKAFAAPVGEGFGTAEPATIFNGGDPSGLVTQIKWSGWGNPTVIGYGLNPIFKPHGGYYRKPARIELRATDLGKCGNRRAYTRLEVRIPKHPGGKLGKWFDWSGVKIDLQAALLRQLRVRRDHPVRPAARPARNEATEEAAMLGDPAVAAFARAREAGEDGGRTGAAAQQAQGGSERGAGAEALPGGRRDGGRCVAKDEVPGRVSFFDAEVGEQPVRGGGPERQGTKGPGAVPVQQQRQAPFAEAAVRVVDHRRLAHAHPVPAAGGPR